MIKFLVYTRDTRIFDCDYIIEKPEKLLELVPYLNKKIEGEWRIALLLPPIKFARKLTDDEVIPKHAELTVYLERGVSEQLCSERPQLVVKQKTPYERFMDSIGEKQIPITPKAARELYYRVGVNKDKLDEYLVTLGEENKGREITQDIIRKQIPDERKVYASDVLLAFLMKDRSRWKKYNTLVSSLGQDYAFNALRKYSNKLLHDKNHYLRNEDTEIRGIDKIDGFKVSQAYILFHTCKSSELDICMRLLDERELMRRIL